MDDFILAERVLKEECPVMIGEIPAVNQSSYLVEPINGVKYYRDGGK